MYSTYVQALVSGLAAGGIYALIALSFSVTFTATRTLNFGQGEVVSFGAFVGVTVLVLVSVGGNFHALPYNASEAWRYPAALVVAGILAGLVGVLVFLMAIRPFAGQPGLNWVVSTIGFGIILQNLGLMTWGAQPVNVPAPFGDGIIRFLGAGVRPQEILVIVSAFAIMFAYDMVMRHTRVGKAMLAVAFSPSAASLMGINVRAFMIAAFVLSSAIAGIAGVLISPISTASLFIGMGFALKAFSGAILGGLNSPRGCMIGGLIVGVFESYVALWQAQWREILVFVLIIAVLAIRPNGLFGSSTVEKV